MEVRGSSLVAAKRVAKRSALLLDEFSNARLLPDLVSGSGWLDAYRQRRHGAGPSDEKRKNAQSEVARDYFK